MKIFCHLKSAVGFCDRKQTIMIKLIGHIFQPQKKVGYNSINNCRNFCIIAVQNLVNNCKTSDKGKFTHRVAMDDLEFDNQFDLDDVVDADLHHSLQDKIKKYVRNRKYLVGHAGLCTIQIIVLIVFLAIIIPIALNKDENDNHDNNSNNNSTWKFTPPANRFKFSDMFKYSMEYPEITWIGNDRNYFFTLNK